MTQQWSGLMRGRRALLRRLVLGLRRHRRRPDVQGGPQQAVEAVAELVQQGGRGDPCRRRAPLRDHETRLRLPPLRYIGLVRNACHLHLLCTAINLKRALAIAG